MKRNSRKRFSLKNSLLSQYFLIIVAAMIVFPASYIGLTLTFLSVDSGNADSEGRLRNGVDLENMWHQEARLLNGADEQTIRAKLSAIRADYPEATVFWVDAAGATRIALSDADVRVPDRWTPSRTAAFMKTSYGGDPFTSVAFPGNDPDQGFMVFQVPRSFLAYEPDHDGSSTAAFFAVTGGTGLILALFLFISWLFFYRMRKRLLRLQQAMTEPDDKTGIPNRVPATVGDEIGRLEASFNGMIGQLEDSRRREREEETLRRQLIANLSHDLRTPLTTIRGHAFRLKQEPIGDEGRQSLELIDRKIGYLDRLIDNLLSYTLLSAGKYPYRPQQVDIVRLVRTLLAGWYPVFEREGFAIELELPDQAVYWRADAQWLERVLDNLLQNVRRHAASGKYVGVAVVLSGETYALTVTDRGPGMGAESDGKGAGIGLSIVSLMLKEMRLSLAIDTGEGGTTIRITPI